MRSGGSGRQYNIIAVRKDLADNIIRATCLPHGKDKRYKFFDKQKISYGMSDYRTTLFLTLDVGNNRYVIGNTHTDNISIEGKVKGILKSLEYMDKQLYTRAVLLGDMNMVPHMAECHTILSHNNNYTALSKDPGNVVPVNSYHGYGINESVNVDFAFVPKETSYNYHWKCYPAMSIEKEGSDHCSVIITVD